MIGELTELTRIIEELEGEIKRLRSALEKIKRADEIVVQAGSSIRLFSKKDMIAFATEALKARRDD